MHEIVRGAQLKKVQLWGADVKETAVVLASECRKAIKNLISRCNTELAKNAPLTATALEEKRLRENGNVEVDLLTPEDRAEHQRSLELSERIQSSIILLDRHLLSLTFTVPDE